MSLNNVSTSLWIPIWEGVHIMKWLSHSAVSNPVFWSTCLGKFMCLHGICFMEVIIRSEIRNTFHPVQSRWMTSRLANKAGSLQHMPSEEDLVLWTKSRERQPRDSPQSDPWASARIQPPSARQYLQLTECRALHNTKMHVEIPVVWSYMNNWASVVLQENFIKCAEGRD